VYFIDRACWIVCCLWGFESHFSVDFHHLKNTWTESTDRLSRLYRSAKAI
jgi:hypothetical protein